MLAFLLMMFDDGGCGAGVLVALVIASANYYHITMTTMIITGTTDAAVSSALFDFATPSPEMLPGEETGTSNSGFVARLA